MLGDAIGAIVTPAAGVALTPLAIIAMAIFLPGPFGMRNGVLFTFGWMFGLSLASAALIWLFDETIGDDTSMSTLEIGLRIALGGVLIVLGVKKGIERMRADSVTEEPRWLKSLEGMSAGRALMLGLLSTGINPKIFVFTAAAVSGVAESGATRWQSSVAVILYVVIGSIGAIGLLAVALVGGQRASGFIGSVRAFMVANMDIIVALISVLLGASILGDGIAGIRD